MNPKQLLENAKLKLESQEEHDETDQYGKIFIKIGLAFVLILWILTMIWVCKNNLTLH